MDDGHKEAAVLPGMELMNCPQLAVPLDVMQHVVRVESSFNPYAIGVVGGRLARQPANLPEAVATARMLENRGFNFSLGLAQVNRYNLARYGLKSYEQAFQACPNLQAGSRILAECHGRSGRDWGKSFSCYYSGNFTTGFREGYVQKIYASMRGTPRRSVPVTGAIPVHGAPRRRAPASAPFPAYGTATVSPAPERIAPVTRTASIPTRTGMAPSPDPVQMQPAGIAAPADELVLLRPNGEPPRLAGAAASATGPRQAVAAEAAPVVPRDTAFVF